MRKWYAKWHYHRKQPAFQTILKYNGLWTVMYLLRIGVFFSWFYWIATSMRHLYQEAMKQQVKGDIPGEVLTNMVAAFLLIFFVLLGITAICTYHLRKGMLLGILVSVAGPFTILSTLVSVIDEVWPALIVCCSMILLYLGAIIGERRYRYSIHRHSNTNDKKIIMYVTHSLDHVLNQENGIFPLAEAWKPYMTEQNSDMEVGSEHILFGLTDSKSGQKSTGRQLFWTKTYGYVAMPHSLKMTANINILSEMDYLKFVGECLEDNRSVVHVGEHIFGVIVSEEDVHAEEVVNAV